ncbi:MAG TPA: M20/M25/M40 family metallo-hydrolase [Xanthomonadales bacterium]|nr:M20/M25/M40 family metallo-hydrolase [Xanthomonadales bacterium]
MRVLALPLFLACAAAGAQSTTHIDDASLAQAAALRDRAMTKSEAYFILETLTTEVGSRMAGSPGDVRAVEWAKTKFADLRFDKVWTEPVTYPVWVRRAERAQILAPFAHELTLTALGASSGTGSRPIEADVVEYATLDALKAARAEDVRGKIVFIGNRMQRAKDGSGYGPAQAARTQGAAAAAQLGARALLIRSIGTDDNRLPHTGVAVSRNALLADAEAMKSVKRTRSGMPILQTPIPAAALSNPDADLLSRVLERSQPVRVRLTLDVGFEGEHTGANVIGEIAGSEKPDEIVLLGAHLDSWDLGTGAIDDGAGVAITMAVGDLLKRAQVQPKRTIRVVAFANEESGVYGGAAYAEAHAGELAKHVIAAESDFGSGRVWRFSSRVKPEALGAVDQIMQVLAPIEIVRGGNAAGGGADIGPMQKLGMAVASLDQDGTHYFDLHHTANDTLDKVDPKDLDQNVAAWVVFAYLAAQADGDFGSGTLAPAAAH